MGNMTGESLDTKEQDTVDRTLPVKSTRPTHTGRLTLDDKGRTINRTPQQPQAIHCPNRARTYQLTHVTARSASKATPSPCQAKNLVIDRAPLFKTLSSIWVFIADIQKSLVEYSSRKIIILSTIERDEHSTSTGLLLLYGCCKR